MHGVVEDTPEKCTNLRGGMRGASAPYRDESDGEVDGAHDFPFISLQSPCSCVAEVSRNRAQPRRLITVANHVTDAVDDLRRCNLLSARIRGEWF